jgi:hypothetical protein
MLSTSCHCGAVRIELALRPESVTECNCSICRRLGARWAYCERKSARVEAGEAALERYCPGKTLAFVRCRTCGCVVMWDRIEPGGENDRIGINMRLIEDPAALADMRVHRLDGARTWQTAGWSTLSEPEW